MAVRSSPRLPGSGGLKGFWCLLLKRELRRFQRLRGREGVVCEGEGSSGVVEEEREVEVWEEARLGAAGAEEMAEATSERQMRMRCCLAGGMRGFEDSMVTVTSLYLYAGDAACCG
jgi:hypothetical protein